jgi:hypothetical protein
LGGARAACFLIFRLNSRDDSQENDSQPQALAFQVSSPFRQTCLSDKSHPWASYKERQHGRDSSLSDLARGWTAALPTFHHDRRVTSQSADICDCGNPL